MIDISDDKMCPIKTHVHNTPGIWYSSEVVITFTYFCMIIKCIWKMRWNLRWKTDYMYNYYLTYIIHIDCSVLYYRIYAKREHTACTLGNPYPIPTTSKPKYPLDPRPTPPEKFWIRAWKPPLSQRYVFYRALFYLVPFALHLALIQWMTVDSADLCMWILF